MSSRSANSLGERLVALAAWLQRWRPLWTERPFIGMPLSWEADHAEVSSWLRGLSDAQAEALHVDAEGLLEGPVQLARLQREAWQLCATAELPTASLGREHHGALHRWGLGVPGRKREQVLAFAGAVSPSLPEGVNGYVDWCAGKGHLGRALGKLSGRPVLFVERRAELCRVAVERADHEGVTSEALTCDVLEAAPALMSDKALLALHACGALGDAAIAAFLEQDSPLLALAPCCYHHQPGHDTLPLRSSIGRAHPLVASPSQLRLATAEETAAPERTRLRRRRKEAFRQGLDLLLREASGQDRYTRLPPIPKAWFAAPFADWVERVAREHQLQLPPRWDRARAEARGWQRAREAARLSLVRLIFRRPLETYVVLDRALLLAERGREVAVGRFCHRATSPRNLLIVAHGS